MALIVGGAIHQQEVAVEVELPLRRHGRFQCSQRSRGRIARVCKSRQLTRGAIRIHSFKGTTRHDGFAARLPCRGRRMLHSQRH